MKRFALCILSILVFTASCLFAEETHKLDKIIVTPSRIQSSSDSGRTVNRLDESILDMSSYGALQDKIGDVGGIDIRRRSPEGVQADVNIRGSTFEQNTVMIDGIKINDPQTGHHTMDLPLTSFDTGKVEIMKGPASSLYGANSFGGVINILTKPPEDKRIVLSAVGGDNDYFSGGISVSQPLEALKNRFSIEWNRSSAYIPDSEFDIINLSESSRIDTDFGAYDFLFGYAFKEFGANTFYSNLYPREEETTDTRFFKTGGSIEIGNLKIEPKLFLRRHYDKFQLDKNRPGFSTNYHTNYTYGTELGLVLRNAFMDVAYGLELAEDRIFSTNLKKHKRGRTGLYLETSWHIHEKLYLNAGIRQDTFSDFDIEYSPSVNARYFIFDALSARASVGRSYRIPTFTDLYYADAANQGNENLKSESSWTYEAGLDYKFRALNCSMGYFNRQSTDTIDWTRMNSTEKWQASNIGSIKTNGVEASLELKLDKGKAFANYTGLDLFDKHDYQSKYALDYLRQQIASGVEYDLFGFVNSWVLNWKKRIGGANYVTVDAKISKEVVKKKNLTLEAFLEITNLFDKSYSEQSNIQMPGRWIKSGARIQF